MPLQGKGFFIWNIRNCEQGNPEAIASTARAAGLSHLLIKIADRYYPHNVSEDGSVDYVPPLAEALHRQDIQTWGWQYIYGYEPVQEAQMAARRIRQLDLDGFVIDAEKEYELPDRSRAAAAYMQELRKRVPDLPMALSSFRFPALHPTVPWKEFVSHIDLIMPQVYWEKAHNPADQLARCLREFRAVSQGIPIIPTGATYKGGGWRPTVEDLQEFIKAVSDQQLPASNYWSWEFCRRDLPELWEVIAGHTPNTPEPPPPILDISEAYIRALNTHDPERVIELYHPLAIHITAMRTLKGKGSLKAWLATLLSEMLPDAAFTLTSYNGAGPLRHLNWKAKSLKARVDNGNDTLGLLDGKIIYQYSAFNLTSP